MLKLEPSHLEKENSGTPRSWRPSGLSLESSPCTCRTSSRSTSFLAIRVQGFGFLVRFHGLRFRVWGGGGVRGSRVQGFGFRVLGWVPRSTSFLALRV